MPQTRRQNPPIHPAWLMLTGVPCMRGAAVVAFALLGCAGSSGHYSAAFSGHASLAAPETAGEGAALAPGMGAPLAASWFRPSTTGKGCPDPGLQGVVHYVCDCGPGAAPGCVPGDDAAQGTRAAPYRSYAKARAVFAGMGPGEAVALCRGGAFAIDGDRDLTNPRCSAGAPCVLRDYAPEHLSTAAPPPVLRVRDGHGITLENGGAAQHEAGFVFLNLHLRSESGGKSGDGFFFYNDVDDVLVCGTTIDGFAIGLHAAGSNPPGPGSDGRNARIVLRSSRVTNNGGQGWLGGCDGCGVEYTSFENNGFAEAVLNHNVYFAGARSTGMFALQNDLYRSTMVDGKCRGASLVVHGQISGLRIEGNTVREDVGRAAPGCWGIAVDDGYDDRVEGFRDVVIRGNDVVNVGNLGIGVGACQGCRIEDNLVVQEQPFESALVTVPSRIRNPADLPLGPVIVRNNTLVARTSASVVGIDVGREGAGHVIVNNKLLAFGTGPFTCFAYDLPHDRYAARDENVCHGRASAAWTRAFPALSAWQQGSGADRASSARDPGLEPTAGRFRWKR